MDDDALSFFRRGERETEEVGSKDNFFLQDNGLWNPSMGATCSGNAS